MMSKIKKIQNSRSITFRVRTSLLERLEDAIKTLPYKPTMTAAIERGIELAIDEITRATPVEVAPPAFVATHQDIGSGSWVSAGDVKLRYNISEMTLYRWERDEALNFPQPMRIKKRKFFRVEELDLWDKSISAAPSH
jgi:predicted DNA-binding transcriptional regulator AlpA